MGISPFSHKSKSVVREWMMRVYVGVPPRNTEKWVGVGTDSRKTGEDGRRCRRDGRGASFSLVLPNP